MLLVTPSDLSQTVQARTGQGADRHRVHARPEGLPDLLRGHAVHWPRYCGGIAGAKAAVHLRSPVAPRESLAVDGQRCQWQFAAIAQRIADRREQAAASDPSANAARTGQGQGVLRRTDAVVRRRADPDEDPADEG